MAAIHALVDTVSMHSIQEEKMKRELSDQLNKTLEVSSDHHLLREVRYKTC